MPNERICFMNNQCWSNKKIEEKSRYKIFNFKSKSGIEKYNELTSSNTLTQCFQGGDFIKESNKWLKEFKNILRRSFKKIRITKSRQKNEVLSLMREKGYS